MMDIGLGADSPDEYEVTKKILGSNNFFKKPKVFALTAHDNEKAREKSQSAGMCDYIVKPLDADKVKNWCFRGIKWLFVNINLVCICKSTVTQMQPKIYLTFLVGGVTS